MQQVRDKLKEDSVKNYIIEMTAVDGNGMAQPRLNKPFDEVRKDYDDFLSALIEYFDLFKKNKDKLEDLWLQILEYFQLPPTGNHTIFDEIHYAKYGTVLKHPIIRVTLAGLLPLESCG